MGLLRPVQARVLLQESARQVQHRGRRCGFHAVPAQGRGLPQPPGPAAGLSQAYGPADLAIQPLLSRRKHHLAARAH